MINLEAPRQKLLTLSCFLRRNKTVSFLNSLFSLKVFQVFYINAHIDSKYIAKDLISIHEVRKKLMQCAQFGGLYCFMWRYSTRLLCLHRLRPARLRQITISGSIPDCIKIDIIKIILNNI